MHTLRRSTLVAIACLLLSLAVSCSKQDSATVADEGQAAKQEQANGVATTSDQPPAEPVPSGTPTTPAAVAAPQPSPDPPPPTEAAGEEAEDSVDSEVAEGKGDEGGGMAGLGAFGSVGQGMGGGGMGGGANSGGTGYAAGMNQPAAPPADTAPLADSDGDDADMAKDKAEEQKAPVPGPPAKAQLAKPAQRRIQPMPPPKPKMPPSIQFAVEPTVKYLSADDSNSCASPVIVRQAIDAGRYVQPSTVRAYEYLNHYAFDYPAPQGDGVALYAEMRPAAAQGEYSLQVAVRAPDRTLARMKPIHATILLDASGSMAGDSQQLATLFVQGFARKLRPGDLLSIVTVNRTSNVLLEAHPVGQDTDATVSRLLGGLKVTDVTDLEKGVKDAYALAARHYDAGHANRVILVSDGAANYGDLSVDLIAKHAEDSEHQGMYLSAVGVGRGFNDQLMDRFTDKGRGAYIFLDSAAEVARALEDDRFVATFDMAIKDVRLKMVMPAGWAIKKFHGEQISSVKSEVTPQYLSPNDQMIYHLTLATNLSQKDLEASNFQFEAEYRPIGAAEQTVKVDGSVAQMTSHSARILKGDALTTWADALKAVQFPLEAHVQDNLTELDKARRTIDQAQATLNDPELGDILAQLTRYRTIVEHGERFDNARDKDTDDIAAVLGLPPGAVRKVKVDGTQPQVGVKSLTMLNRATQLVPQEGYRFLAMSSGPVGNVSPAGGGSLNATRKWADPMPQFMGNQRARRDDRPIFDLHTVTLELTAPQDARSFSFDFNYFSAEYPNFVKQHFNDTFYASLQAPSTNQGAPTNISFDARGNTIEVDNNYFQGQFHPIGNQGTGFDSHGSTGWLRTSWPIRGGESFKITFSIHDEGDSVYDSLVLLDNLQFHNYEAVGNTDPLN